MINSIISSTLSYANLFLPLVCIILFKVFEFYYNGDDGDDDGSNEEKSSSNSGTKNYDMLFTVSSMGFFFISWAAKWIAETIIAGILLRAWGEVNIGDEVRFAAVDGTCTEGTIEEIGLMDTRLRGRDGIVTMIPNMEIAVTRIANLSREPTSRVEQTLRLQLDDIGKTPLLMKAIQKEIERSCPLLISESSSLKTTSLSSSSRSTVSAVLTSIEGDHVRAVISCQFNAPPTSDDFSDSRQKMILAIAWAMADLDMKFATTLI